MIQINKLKNLFFEDMDEWRKQINRPQKEKNQLIIESGPSIKELLNAIIYREEIKIEPE